MILLVPVGLILYLGVIWLAMQAARERHRNSVWWGFLAVWISVFALIPLVLLGDSKAGKRRWLEAQEQERQRAKVETEEEIEIEEEARLRARARIEAGG
jgi:cell division protein FtsW (lipid II flippase)